MTNWKEYAKIAVVAILAIAIVTRVAFLSNIVFPPKANS